MSEKLKQLRNELLNAEAMALLEPTPSNIVKASLLRSQVMHQEQKERK